MKRLFSWESPESVGTEVIRALSTSGNITDLAVPNGTYAYIITVTNGAGRTHMLTRQVTVAC